ncbi:nucleoside hydrolase [Frigidibacter sp. MR17.14]|uniref:nucleoside hydrolase n=1 Tax=Frigidibacter sp. MR17.14 TaxID=3126509 RepID=UPI003012A3F7
MTERFAPVPPERLWIDTDMGFDDLAAVLLIRARSTRIDGISLVAGNTVLDQVIRNALSAAEHFGWSFPIHAGAANALSGDPIEPYFAPGETGLPGGRNYLPPVAGSIDSRDAVGAMAEWIREGGRTILALGPLTNIAELLTQHPELAKKFRLLWLGGSAGAGNQTAAAECNAYADPEAVQIVCDSGVEWGMIGLDTCKQVTVTIVDAELIRAMGGPRAEILADMLDAYARTPDPLGRRPMPLYDPVAAAALMDPSTVLFHPVAVDCELQGKLTRGMTVVEWRSYVKPPNTMIATSTTPDMVRELFLTGLAVAAIEEPSARRQGARV